MTPSPSTDDVGNYRLTELPQPFPETEDGDERRYLLHERERVLVKCSVVVHPDHFVLNTIATVAQHRQGYATRLIRMVSETLGRPVRFSRPLLPAGEVLVASLMRTHPELLDER